MGADGILYRGNQILLPASLSDEAITLAHSRTQTGQDAIKCCVRAHFWFPSLDTIVRLLILNSLNQQAPKMHYQPLPPYTPTIAVDNGPAFNSKELGNFSTARGILIMNSYPYHPQGNEAEYFMKPFRKAVKTAIVTSRPSQQAADDLISNYRSSTHPATGVAPGNMFFHGGYKSTDQPKFIKYDFQT